MYLKFRLGTYILPPPPLRGPQRCHHLLLRKRYGQFIQSEAISAFCLLRCLVYAGKYSTHIRKAIAHLQCRALEGGGELPYKGLMGTCGQAGYVFRDFCLKQGIKFIIFCLNQGIDLSIFVLNRVGKSAIFVSNSVRVWGAAPHLPTQRYIEYPPGCRAIK